MRARSFLILALNPGSTSTKVAAYRDEVQLFEKSIAHGQAELARYPSIMGQQDMRRMAILSALAEAGGVAAGEGPGLSPRVPEVSSFDAIVGRGGLLPPVHAGAYRVNDAMIRRLTERPIAEHASNLGAVIARELADEAGAEAYIYDSIAVDELDPVARLSGLPGLERKSLVHALNSRAMALRCAAEMGRPYEELNLIVAHIGGGASVSLHTRGGMRDLVLDDEGPFSAGKAGGLPTTQLVDMIFDEGLCKRDIMERLRGSGGLVAYLGTNDLREAEARSDSGEALAGLVMEAMAYQIAKAIGSLAPVVSGKVDRIIFTGGAARSARLAKRVTEAVSFIAPVLVMPGEDELGALAGGALRVLRGEETAREYLDPDFATPPPRGLP